MAAGRVVARRSRLPPLRLRPLLAEHRSAALRTSGESLVRLRLASGRRQRRRPGAAHRVGAPAQRRVVVLRADLHVVVHRQPGRLPHHHEDRHADQVGRRPGGADEDPLRHGAQHVREHVLPDESRRHVQEDVGVDGRHPPRLDGRQQLGGVRAREARRLRVHLGHADQPLLHAERLRHDGGGRTVRREGLRHRGAARRVVPGSGDAGDTGAQ